jgi:hypothetical protein
LDNVLGHGVLFSARAATAVTLPDPASAQRAARVKRRAD